MPVLLCRCAQAKVLPEPSLQAARQNLRQAGVEFCEVADLCALAQNRDPRLPTFATADSTIVACHPRAVHWLFAAAGAPLAPGVRLINLRTGDAAALQEQLRQVAPSPAPTADLAEPTTQKAWFPVIDFARCTQCLQCLSFCLFDVYAVDAAKHISVERPANCKPDCPACSRVCPEAAIMFPKYAAAPIDGSPVTPENVGREAVKVDVSALMGGDVYQALRNRRRFSKERDPKLALEERRRQLAALGMHVSMPTANPDAPRAPEKGS